LSRVISREGWRKEGKEGGRGGREVRCLWGWTREEVNEKVMAFYESSHFKVYRDGGREGRHKGKEDGQIYSTHSILQEGGREGGRKG